MTHRTMSYISFQSHGCPVQTGFTVDTWRPLWPPIAPWATSHSSVSSSDGFHCRYLESTLTTHRTMSYISLQCPVQTGFTVDTWRAIWPPIAPVCPVQTGFTVDTWRLLRWPIAPWATSRSSVSVSDGFHCRYLESTLTTAGTSAFHVITCSMAPRSVSTLVTRSLTSEISDHLHW